MYANLIIENITAVHDILQRIIEDIDANFKLHTTKRILDRLENNISINLSRTHTDD